jgi:tetratricopeptide (TPR) repeat protein
VELAVTGNSVPGFPLKTAYYILAFGSVLAAPLAVGGVHTSVAACLLLANLGALFLQFRLLERRDESQSDMPEFVVSLPSMAFWFFAAVALLQLIPLPASLHSVLQPEGWRLYEAGWEVVFGSSAPRAWRPLSLDPVETVDRFMRWVTLGLVSLVACNHPRVPGGRGYRRVLYLLVGTGLLVTLIGALQSAVGTSKVLFLYEPLDSVKDLTTFINPNHAAVFCAVTALAGVALTLRAARSRYLEASVAALVSVGLILSMFIQNSVGATVGFGAGFVGLIFAFLRSRRSLTGPSGGEEDASGSARSKLLLGFVVSLALTIGGLGLFGAETLRETGADTNPAEWSNADKRVELIDSALEATGDYPVVGAGAGATDSVLAPYIDWSSRLHSAKVPTIENEPVEWLFQYGPLFGVLGSLFLLGYLWFPGRGFFKTRSFRFGTALTLAAVLLFNANFHFPFFTLGIAIPALWLVEASASSAFFRYSQSTRSSLRQTKWAGWMRLSNSGSRVLLGIGGVCSLMSFVGMWGYHTGTLTPEKLSRGELQRKVKFNPADGDVYADVAIRSSEDENWSEAVERAEYAFEREPKRNMALLLARTYRAADRTDAAVETFRRIFGPQFTAIPNEWIEEYLVPTLREPELVARALQDASQNEWFLAYEAFRERQGESVAVQFAQALADHRPDHNFPYEFAMKGFYRMDQMLLVDLWARMLIERETSRDDSGDAKGYRYLARAKRRQGERREAQKLARTSYLEYPDDRRLARQVVIWRSRNPEEGSELEARAITAVVDHHCFGDDADAMQRSCWQARGWLYERDGNFEQAGHTYRRIATQAEDPDPVPYARFLSRREQCARLDRFVERWSDRAADDLDSSEKLNRIAADCRS